MIKAGGGCGLLLMMTMIIRIHIIFIDKFMYKHYVCTLTVFDRHLKSKSKFMQSKDFWT